MRAVIPTARVIVANGDYYKFAPPTLVFTLTFGRESPIGVRLFEKVVYRKRNNNILRLDVARGEKKNTKMYNVKCFLFPFLLISES